MSDFFLPTCQGYLLKLHVVPGAGKTEVAGRHGDRLKVRVAAPPAKGRANQELLDFLARTLKVARQSLKLSFGAAGRAKVVEIHDLAPDLGSRLQSLLAPSSPPTRPAAPRLDKQAGDDNY